MLLLVLLSESSLASVSELHITSYLSRARRARKLFIAMRATLSDR